MTLWKKTLLKVSATVIALLVVLSVASRTVMLNSFIVLEENLARQNVQRALSSLDDHLSSLENTTSDYALWDQTYSFMSGGNPGYTRSEFPDDAFIRIRIGLVMLIDTGGNVVLSKSYDLANRREIAVPSELNVQRKLKRA